MKIAQSWGQVWTSKKWGSFKRWYNQNLEFVNNDTLPKPLNEWSSKSSWLKYYDRFCIENNKYFVYPYYSISTNFSDPGIHSKILSNDSQSILLSDKIDFSFPTFCRDAIVYDEFMEREYMEKHLDLKEGTLSVDLYGNKPVKSFKKHLLRSEEHTSELQS